MPQKSHLISVVTPTYNAAVFLPHAYACLCRQSYENWEWVVVDDGSTDETPTLLLEWTLKDSRIRYFTQENSGSAKLPRDHAVYESRGTLVFPLDADDIIEDNYLKKMLERMLDTDADIVYPHMDFIDMATGKIQTSLPVTDFDSTRIYRGRDLVRETMPEWRIGCNGGLYRREIWLNMSWPPTHEPIWVYSDEVDERIYQIHAHRVAFASAHYLYQIHNSSITNKVSPKLFEILNANYQLLDVVENAFSKNSLEYRRANQKLFNNWRNMMKFYVCHHKALTSAEDMIRQNLETTFNRIEPQLLSKWERIKFLNLCSFPLLFAIFSLKYSLVKKVIQHIAPC